MVKEKENITEKSRDLEKQYLLKKISRRKSGGNGGQINNPP